FAASTMELAIPALLFRPQDFGTGVPDLRNDARPSAEAVTRQDQRAPVIGRLEAYVAKTGAQDSYASYTFPPGTGRHGGGPATGVITLFPPETGGEDSATGFAPPGIALSKVHFNVLPGSVWYASGIPSPTTAGIATGFRHASDATGNYNFDRANAAGAI